MPRKKSSTLPAIAGMQDILPEEQKYYRYIFKKADALLEDYGFERLNTPPIEPSELYLRAAGSGEDQVAKQLFTFKTRDGQDAALRYEGSASLMRAYWENGMHTRPHPVKLFFSDPVYWADAGERKIRQTYHIGAETIGDASEVVDAELLFLAYKIVDSLGFHGYNIHINTLGDNNCRPAYIRALKDFYKNKLKKVCVKCRNNFKINILRLLECTDEPCRQAMQDAPQTVEFLDEECKTHFKHILEFLDSAQIPYILNPYLVRSQDYYTRTVFEFWPEEAAGGAPLVFGGRHDKLSDLIGGSKTPSAGWTLDLPAVISLLKEKNASVPEVGVKPKVFLVQLGEAAKRKSLLLFEDIRKSGVEIRFSLARDSIKSQLRIATRLGVKFTLIFGQKEAIEGTVILREMETGIQETIPVEKIIEELKKRLKK